MKNRNYGRKVGWLTYLLALVLVLYFSRRNMVETALRHFQEAFERRFETQLTVMPSRNSMLVLVFLSLPKSSSIASTGGTPVSARRSRTILLSSSGW